MFVRPFIKGAFLINDPTDIANLVLWLDGNDITTLFTFAGSQPFGAGTTQVISDGGVVRSWLDKSGNANHMNGVATGASYRTNVQNSLSVVRNETTAYLYSTSTVLSQDANVTIFYVGKLAADETVGVAFCNNQTTGLRIAALIDSRAATNRAGVVSDSTGTALGDVNSDVGTEFNQFTVMKGGGNIAGRLNGVAGTPAAYAGDGVTANDYTRVFNQHADATPLVGDLAELIVYDALLSATQILAVEAYLKAKWATP